MGIERDQQFAQFWRAYPRRVSKGKARDAFSKALKKTTLSVMLKALEWQVLQPGWLKDDGEFVPYPASWLNAERWDDEPFHPAIDEDERWRRELEKGRPKGA